MSRLWNVDEACVLMSMATAEWHIAAVLEKVKPLSNTPALDELPVPRVIVSDGIGLLRSDEVSSWIYHSTSVCLAPLCLWTGLAASVTDGQPLTSTP